MTWLGETSGETEVNGCLVGTAIFLPLLAVLLFWAAFILARPLGATIGDYLDELIASGGLAISRPAATAALAVIIVVCIALFSQ